MFMDNLLVLLVFVWCLCMVFGIADLVLTLLGKRKPDHFDYKL